MPTRAPVPHTIALRAGPVPSLRPRHANSTRSSRRQPWWRQCVRCSGSAEHAAGPRGDPEVFPMLQPGMDNPGQAGAVFLLFAEEVRAAAEQVEAAVEVVQLAQRVLKGQELGQEELGGLGEVAAGELEQVAKLLHGDAHAVQGGRGGVRERSLEALLEAAQALAEHLARPTVRQLCRLGSGTEQARERLCVPFLQRRLQRAFHLAEKRSAAAQQDGVAALEPGDLELQIADVAKRVLELLDRPIELAQP